MSFDLTALASYTKDNADVLITKALTKSKTAALITKEGNVQTGIKTAERIGQFDTDLVLQDGTVCGWNPSGSTKISQRTITVGTPGVNEALCQKDLDKAYTQLMMQAQGANSDALPGEIEKAYTETKVMKIQTANEKLLWQGDISKTGDASIKWADGYLKIIDSETTTVAVNAKKASGTITATTGAATVVGVSTKFSSEVGVSDKIYSGGVLIGTVLSITDNTHLTFTANGAAAATGAAYTIAPAAVAAPILASTGIVAANVLAIFDSVYSAIPAALLDNQEVSTVYIFAGSDVVRTYLLALKNANLYHFTSEAKDLANGFVLPGTNIKVMPLPGLTGTNRIVCTHIKNMWMGTDLENEAEEFELWFSKDNGEMRFRAAWRIGAQFGFMDEVVQFLLAA